MLQGAIAGAIAISLFFLVRWSGTLEKAVRARTEELSAKSDELQVANERLVAHDKMQQEFINVAAHELRTPIQPLLVVAGLLEQEFDGNSKIEMSREEFDIIRRNTNRLERLSSDILEVSRIESQSLKLNKEKVELNTKIRAVIEDCKSFIEEGQNIEISFQSVMEPLYVEADKSRLFEVISNLLKNAIKFTQDGQIKILLEETEGSVVVKVSDTGRGIDPKFVPRLFTKFATNSEMGTGLGLYISKAIVEAHGGKIWAGNNQEGGGATFQFSLPAVRSEVTKAK